LPPDHVTDNPEAVLAYAARTLGRSQAPTIAGRLAAGLATTPDLAPGVVALVDAALILAADNGLARPTLCARIVASVGGEMRYGVVAGMCAMRGTLPGAAAHSVDHLLSQIDATGAAQAGAIIRAAVAAKGTTLPGVGHQMYPGGDPRAQELLRRLLSSPSLDPCRVAVVTTAVDALKRESLPAPNFDFALAALCYAAGLRAGGSEALFCVGRMAGWLAHMLEERHRSSNFRLNGVYVGLWPSSTVPLSGLDGMPV
jgi:citrate synthase